MCFGMDGSQRSGMLSALTLVFGLATVVKAEEPTVGVDMKLVSSAKAVAPSSTFTVGLEIHHHPGFHTYWKNPGAVGYPIQIKWELPEGFKAGEVRWPVPEMSSMAGHPVFGYETDATLLVDLTAPDDLPEGELEFHADVAWMACSNSCHPDNRRFSISVSVGEKAVLDEEQEAFFANAEKRIPKVLEGWDAMVKSETDAEVVQVVLTPPDSVSMPPDLLFYSEDGQVSSDPVPTVERSDDGEILIEAMRSQFSPKEKESLPFVLVGEGGEWFGRLDPVYGAK